MSAVTHPLPAGMRDLLPEEARERRWLAQRVLSRIELFGYEPVLPPAFELADVLERGLGALDAADVLRFVDPESGEVAAFRPDMTPQIARMIATRLGGRPPPVRLAYEGTVLRRSSARGRKRRQIPQLGAELVGLPGLEGDLEILEVIVAALSDLPGLVIDLGDAGIVRALLATLPQHEAAPIAEAIGRKDEAEVEARMRAAGGDPAVLVGLLRARTLEDGLVLLARTPAEAAARRLEALHHAARDRGLGDRVTADLGEIRSAAYYTGMVFRAYAPGSPEAVGSGGRYDDLLAQFGAPMPAVGFAIDLDALAAAERAAGARPPVRDRALVVGDAARARALRKEGVIAVAHEPKGAEEYAAQWGYTRVVT